MSGTTCGTIVCYDDGKDPICLLERTYDGYPSGHGKELKDFLSNIKLVNGISPNNSGKKQLANGMTCLAAQLIAHFKDTAGNFYLLSPDIDEEEFDYSYTVYNKKKQLYLQVKRDGKKIYDGKVTNYKPK